MGTAIGRYLTPPLDVRAVGLAVTGVGRITEQRKTWSNRTLTTYAGVFVTDGVGQFSIRGCGGFHHVHPGNFFWLPPGVPHHYGPMEGRSWDEYWVLFEGPATSAYEGLGLLGASGQVMKPADADLTYSMCKKLLQLAGQPESVPTHLSAAASLHTLIAAVGIPGSWPIAAQASERDLGRRALDILARDAHRPLSIAAVARELSISRDTLAREVRRLTGSTPSAYLTHYRVTQAKSLLAGTDMPVAAIAQSVGFNDPAYFTRVFTQAAGISPTLFRKQERAGTPKSIADR